jgi:methionyl aminopeptidase
VGEVSVEVKALLQTTKESLYKGIEHARENGRIGDIGSTIQEYCEKRGFSVVRELVGHGIGRQMHEAPEVPNYGRRGKGPIIKNGMCIAIEPMINMGSKKVVFENDGWTVRTKDRKPSAHFEHTVAIRNGKADILSTFEFINETN